MNYSKRQFVIAAAMVASVVVGTRAQADFHLFYIKEIFTNHDGSVQFIELFTNSIGQQNLNPNHSITSSTQTYDFPNDSPAPTNGHHVLIATEGFGAILGGATPEYVIPSNFFDPAGDTITFGEGVSFHTFGGVNPPIPTDGVNSLNYTSFFSASTVAQNSPRNYAGAGTSVNLPPPPVTTGDYNGDGFVNAADYPTWRNTLGDMVTPGEGADGSGPGGVPDGLIDQFDYAFWKDHYGDIVPGSGAALGEVTVPEPATIVIALIGAALLVCRRKA